MKKRGISPLIATVLVIGFVIVLGSMFMIWGFDFVKNYQERTEFKSKLQLECASKVNLNIKEACDLGNKVRLMVENTGDKTIEGFKLRIYGIQDVQIKDISKNLNSFSVEKLKEEVKFRPSKKIEIIPKIKIKDEEGYCSPISQKIDPCFSLPSIHSCNEWEGDCEVITEEITIGSGDNEFTVEEGIYSENGINIKSESFVVPGEANYLSIKSIVSPGKITYKLVDAKSNEELGLWEDNENIYREITTDYELSDDVKGKTIRLVIEKSEGIVTLNQLNYEV